MSYDLYFFRRNNIKEPFKPGEVELRLKDHVFKVSEFVKDGYAMGFNVTINEGEEEMEFYHQKPEGSYYSTGCSYGVGKESFEGFKKGLVVVAKKLDLLIQDPQMGNDEIIEPDDFVFDEPKSGKAFQYVQNQLRNINYISPAAHKHFILYFVMAEEPATKNVLTLLTEDGLLLAGKVNKGESINQVVGREMPELTGQDKYRIVKVVTHDTARDRYGNELPRYAVSVVVPYFDPEKANTKRPMHWKNYGTELN